MDILSVNNFLLFRYESSSGSNENAGLGTETTVAVTTTSVVNLNVSSAGIDACAGAAISWRKTAELEVAARETESVSHLLFYSS